ncbi:MAG: hypothetical protein B7C24_02910 [Bacteroidetes bacterium 4572_77]|nr:MAG: hypothetical protein B7C24_02910 [Bacteroidetes bacterium 4572_77]
MVKKTIQILLLFFILYFGGLGSLVAQTKGVPNQPRYDRKKIHFGFYLGANQMLYTLKMRPGFSSITYYQDQIPEFNADSAYLYNVEAVPQLGFTIGIVSSLTLGKYFNLRFTPELLFSERKLRYDILTYYRDEARLIKAYEKKIPSTHLNFPFYVKYKGVRLFNVRPYVFVGFKFVIDLAAQAGKKEDVNERDIVVKLYRSDFAFETGVGFDFYFNWFKMGAELRMSYGFKDILKKENNIYTDPIESLNSRIFQLVFTFE